MQQLGCLPLVRGVYGVRILIREIFMAQGVFPNHGKGCSECHTSGNARNGEILSNGVHSQSPPSLSAAQQDHCSPLHDACLNRTSVFKKEASSKTETAEVICTPKRLREIEMDQADNSDFIYV